MAVCVTGKNMYLTQEAAEEALIQSWIRNDFAPGQGPISVYKCGDCSQFHLTSTGQMNTTLATYIREGKLKRQKEADYWEKKLKR